MWVLRLRLQTIAEFECQAAITIAVLVYVLECVGVLGELTGGVPALLGVGGCQADADSVLIDLEA